MKMKESRMSYEAESQHERTREFLRRVTLRW